MKHQMILVVTIMVSACSTRTNPTESPIVVEAVEEPFVEPTGTPDCQHANGVTLEISRTADSKVLVRALGLEPGEIPYMTFDTTHPYGGMRLESGRFANGADKDGTFSYEEILPGLPEGVASVTWDFRFIHARGVECATIIQP
jgi:hypothetical protein